MNESDDVIDFSEARDRFPDQWLALDVVSRDKESTPLRVRVLARAGTRLEVRDRVRDAADVYITFTGPVVPDGQGVLFVSARLGHRALFGE